MQYFQQIECGLPSKDFVLSSVDSGQPAASRVGEGRRVARFKPGSPWCANQEAGERLTWRGRNYIEAFAAINHCDVLRATMFDLLAGQCLRSLAGGAPTGGRFELYHFVCEASEGSRMQVGSNVLALRAGDLWRVYGGNLPRIVHGGSEGGMHFELVLARRHATGEAGMLAEHQNSWDCQNKSGAAA